MRGWGQRRLVLALTFTSPIEKAPYDLQLVSINRDRSEDLTGRCVTPALTHSCSAETRSIVTAALTAVEAGTTVMLSYDGKDRE